MKEPLEEFFRKKLSSDTEESWNMPSDDIWEKALPHFKQEKKKRRFGFWWFFGALSVISIFIIFGYNNQPQNNISTIETTLVKEASKKSELPEEERIQEAKALLPNKKLKKSTITQKVLPLQKKPIAKIQERRPIKEEFINNDRSLLTAPKIVSLTIMNDETNQKKNDFELKNEALELKIDNQPVDVLNRLPLLSPRLNSNLIIINSPSISKLKSSKKPKWAVSLMYGASMSRFEIEPLDENTIKGSKEYQFSNNFKIGVTRYLSNHWGLYSGIGLVTIHSESKIKETMAYDHSSERVMSNDLIASDVSFQTASPLGDIELSSMISRPSSMPVPIGDNVDAYLTNNQMVRYVNVPIGLRLSNRFSSKFSGYGKVGLNFNYLLNDQSSTAVRMMHDLDEMGKETMSISRKKPLSNSVFSYEVGAGVERLLTSKLSIFVDMNYMHSLTPVIKSSQHTTNMSTFQLNVGVQHSF